MATRSNKQPLSHEKAHPDWRQNRAILAASSFGAGLLFAWQIIVPVQTSRLEAKLEILKEDSERIEKLKSEAKDSRESYEKLNTAYQTLITKNPFKTNQAQPLGFEDIQMGASFSKATKTPGADLTDLDRLSYFRVKRDAGIFRAVTIYKLSEADEIRGLLFHAKPLAKMQLVKHMEDAHGAPTYVDKFNDRHWHINKYWIKVSDETNAIYAISMTSPTGYEEKSKDNRKDKNR